MDLSFCLPETFVFGQLFGINGCLDNLTICLELLKDIDI